MAYWLMKSEPETYGIEDLARDKRTEWEGVRNYTARNFLRAMRTGDRAFFYHSSVVPPAVVGEMTVVRTAYPDPAQFDPRSDYHDPASKRTAPRWSAVDVKFVRTLPTPVTRDALRVHPALRRLLVLTQPRLSVTPVPPEAWRIILGMAK